jgi:hypothetical protein
VEESITLPRLGALREYWRKVPPTSLVLAASHGLIGHGVGSGARGGSLSVSVDPPIKGKELFEFLSIRGGTVRG